MLFRRISIVMKSKRLGSSQTTLRRFRFAVAVLLCALLPLYTIATILSALQEHVNIVSILASTTILLLVFIVVFGTSYHLLVTVRWAFSFDEPTSMTRRVGIRSIWLAVINISLLGYGIVLILNSTIRWRDAKQAFSTLAFSINFSVFFTHDLFRSCHIVFNILQHGDECVSGHVN